LSRDPIGERGGHNTYCFVNDDPIVHVDPLGLACCCCCAEYLDIFGLASFTDEDADLFGHSFRLVATMKFVHSKSGTTKDCAFSWKERSNRPPPDAEQAGAKPNEWYDVLKIPNSVPAFKWSTHHTACLDDPNGIALTAVNIPDNPAANLSKPKRVLDFVIKLESSPGCSCTHRSVTLNATQTLDPGNYPNSLPSLPLPETFIYTISYED
jgi:hypothetical protein